MLEQRYFDFHYLFFVCLYEKRFLVLSRCQQPCASFSSARLGHYLRRKLSKLMADHVLRYPNIIVALAIVNLENEAHEVRQDRCSAGLRLDRR